MSKPIKFPSVGIQMINNGFLVHAPSGLHHCEKLSDAFYLVSKVMEQYLNVLHDKSYDLRSGEK